ncbi:MAG: hypothetical protein QM492_09335 [Rhodobacterales bacterium]
MISNWRVKKLRLRMQTTLDAVNAEIAAKATAIRYENPFLQ